MLFYYWHFFYYWISSMNLFIEKPHIHIRVTSHYKLLQACDKHFTSCSQACCKLAKAWLFMLGWPFTRMLQSWDKPAASCFVQVNFRSSFIFETDENVFLANFIVSFSLKSKNSTNENKLVRNCLQKACKMLATCLWEASRGWS